MPVRIVNANKGKFFEVDKEGHLKHFDPQEQALSWALILAAWPFQSEHSRLPGQNNYAPQFFSFSFSIWKKLHCHHEVDIKIFFL